jgi:hypothetical protein
VQLDLLESNYNGRLVVFKSANATLTKFFDLDELEPAGEIFTGKGLVYCSRDGDYVCTIEPGTPCRRLIIRDVESGEFHASVDLDDFELGHVFVSANYATIIFRKTPSPLLVDLRAGKLIKTLPYQTCFSMISPDDTVLLVHSERHINYFLLPSVDRAVELVSVEIPETVVFTASNKRLFVLTKDTKEVVAYDITLEKRLYTTANLIQDKEIVELKCSADESILLVCSLHCVYVFDLRVSELTAINLKFKVDVTSIENFLSLTRATERKDFDNENDVESDEMEDGSKNVLTGFGCSTDNTVLYVSYYTYLVCFNAFNGNLIRLFQSTLSANRILKSFPSRLSDAFISLLDNGTLVVWNVGCVNYSGDLTFENMNTFHEPITDCLIPAVASTHAANSNLVVSYARDYPDAKVHDLKNYAVASATLAVSSMGEKSDNSLTSCIRFVALDAHGRFCFLVNDVEDFVGKRLPDEQDFVKRICSVIDLTDGNRVVEKMSFVIKKNSRFDIHARFVQRKRNFKEISNSDDVDSEETYLLVKQVSCINDFDPFSALTFDWTEFETIVKVFGPVRADAELKLYDEFKLEGEMLGEYDVMVNKNHTFVCLMQECQKLYDKEQPGVVKAKRYDVNLNTYELFESKVKSLKVQRFSLNEFLTIDDYGSGKNVYLDVKVTFEDTLLLVYSKEGAVSRYM